MNIKRKRLYFVILLIFLLSAGMLFFCYKPEKQRDFCHMSFFATDAYTLKPLENAVIVLPEFQIQATTDQNGNATFYNLPYKNSAALEKLMPAGFAQTTVLCYCQGYQPYALFYAELRKNRMREGVTLYMFPENEESGCLVEAPPQEWVKELLEFYRP